MKKKLFSFLFCLLLLCTLILPVSAASSLVMDYAGIMSNTETADLEERARQLQSTYGLDVVILTAPKLYDVPIQDFADDFYDNNGYAADGVLFLLDMGGRQWYISTAGSAIEGLSDRDLAKIEDTVIPYFSEGRYYEGFSKFLNQLPGLLTNDASGSGGSIFVSLLVGAGLAAIVLLIMRSSMNTKKLQRSAGNYETEGTYHLRTHQDLFLYSNVSKRPRPQNNSSGGSSVHRGSSGRSHGGRGGRF